MSLIIGPVTRQQVFKKLIWDDGSANSFIDSQAVTVAPTHFFWDKGSTLHYMPHLDLGVITHIRYMMTPTNAVTYTLRIWRGNWGDYDPTALLTSLIWESAGAKASGTMYKEPTLENGLNIPFHLWPELGKMYYSLEWTGAPGATRGLIEVHGIAYQF